MEETTHHLTDDRYDILSHRARAAQIHVLTLDPVLAEDVCERIQHDPRTEGCLLVTPRRRRIREAVEEIEAMAAETVSSRLLIIDVRKATIPKLRRAYNKVVGYNRRDLNKLCFVLLIGDGPWDLFYGGKGLDIFVTYLAAHRVDFHPAAFFYDPFLHYERDEIEHPGIDDEFVLPEKIPRRLIPYFKNQDMRVAEIRRYFRATDKDDELRAKRRRRLRRLYKKRIAEQFPADQERLRAWRSKKGLRIASERMHLYPLYFEDWVHDLLQKAARAKSK
ncbi:MAG: hypothetical protein JSW66_06020 [Phycisphaerales bacterium]|nr:MAG: hypothetical protein JSW66_06020 [Phycisphaerales bacterium]